LNARKRRLEYINVGHPAAYVLGADGAVKGHLTSETPAIGLNREGTFPAVGVAQLAPGEIVLFLTDGVLESSSPAGEDFGVERLLQVVRDHAANSASQIVGAVTNAVRQFSAPAAQQDDITVVVVKVV